MHERWKLSLICENWSGRDKIFQGVCKGKLFQFIFKVFYKTGQSLHCLSKNTYQKISTSYCINLKKKKKKGVQQKPNKELKYFLLPQSPHFTPAKCSTKQDSESLQNCTQKGQLLQTLSFSVEVYITRGLALGRQPKLGRLSSHNRASV